VLSGACYTINNATGTTMISAILSGAGFLTKSGAGTLILSGTNTYTGITTINGGVLSITSFADGGTGSGIGASSGAAANLILGGGTLQYTGGTVTINRSFTLGADVISTIDVANAGTVLTASGAATATSGSLRKSGAGTLVLTGTNRYTGATIISAGVLQVGAGSTNGALGTGPVTNDSALVFNRSDMFYTNMLSISGTGSVTKKGNGTLYLFGDNTYMGDTIVSGGMLTITNAYLSETAAVCLTNSAKLNLNFNDIDRIGYLYFEGQAQFQGYWGAPGSGAVNTNGIYLGGTGILLVTRGPPPPGTTIIVR